MQNADFENGIGMTRARGEGSPRKRKDGRWEHAITIGKTARGNPKRVSFYGITRKEASQKATKALAEQQAGTFTASEPTTVADLLERWIDFRATNHRLKPTTKHSYAWIIKQYLVPQLGSIRVTSLTPLQVEQFQGRLARDGLSPRTIRYARSLLSSALKQAMRWGLIHRNVVDFVDAPRVGKPKRTVWQPNEARQFLETARPERLYALFHLALVTGLRRGELLGLRWRDLDLRVVCHHAGTISVNKSVVHGRDTNWQAAGILLPARIGIGSQIPEQIREWHTITKILDNGCLDLDAPSGRWRAGTPYVIEELRGSICIANTVSFIGAKPVQLPPKTDRSERQLDLDPLTAGVLLERRAAFDLERQAAGEAWRDFDLVFGSQWGTPTFESTLRRIKTRILTAAKVPHVSTHGIRYTYTSLAAFRELDIKLVSERLGHTTTRMTQDTYQQTYRQAHRRAALSSDELFGK